MGVSAPDHGHEKLQVWSDDHREWLKKELQRYRTDPELECSLAVRKGVIAALKVLLRSPQHWEFHATLEMKMMAGLNPRPQRDQVDQIMAIMRDLTSTSSRALAHRWARQSKRM